MVMWSRWLDWRQGLKTSKQLSLLHPHSLDSSQGHPIDIWTDMAAISRTFASQLVNRSYVNAPASAGALKKAFSISSSSRDEESQAPTSHYASTKNRSSAGPLNRSFVNGKEHLRNFLNAY